MNDKIEMIISRSITPAGIIAIGGAIMWVSVMSAKNMIESAPGIIAIAIGSLMVVISMCTFGIMFTISMVSADHLPKLNKGDSDE